MFAPQSEPAYEKQCQVTKSKVQRMGIQNEKYYSMSPTRHTVEFSSGLRCGTQEPSCTFLILNEVLKSNLRKGPALPPIGH